MYCTKCGSQVSEGTPLCPVCGSNVIGVVKKKKGSKSSIIYMLIGGAAVAIIVAILACLTPVFNGDRAAKASIESKSFETPEKAIEYFFERIADNDVNGAIQACTVYEYSKIDYTKYSERMSVMLPTAYAPNEYEMYQDSNILRRQGAVAQKITNLCYSLLSDNDVIEGLTIVVESKDEIQDFIKEVDPARLSDLSVVSIDYCMPQNQDRENMQKNLEQIADVYQAEKVKEYVVLLEFEGKYYMTGYAMKKYDDGWKIDESSSLAALPSSWNVSECTKEEYKEYYCK